MATPQITIAIAGASSGAAYWGYNNLTIFPGAVTKAANFFATSYGVSASTLTRLFKGVGFGTAAEWKRDRTVKSHLLLHQKYAGALGIDPALTMGIEWYEGADATRMTYNAKINDYAVGLMQILVSTAQGIIKGVTANDLKNPEININIGTRVFKDFYDKAGNIEDALNMYNSGRTMAQLNLFYSYVIFVLKKYYDFATVAASKIITTDGKNLSPAIEQSIQSEYEPYPVGTNVEDYQIDTSTLIPQLDINQAEGPIGVNVDQSITPIDTGTTDISYLDTSFFNVDSDSLLSGYGDIGYGTRYNKLDHYNIKVGNRIYKYKY